MYYFTVNKTTRFRWADRDGAFGIRHTLDNLGYECGPVLEQHEAFDIYIQEWQRENTLVAAYVNNEYIPI